MKCTYCKSTKHWRLQCEKRQAVLAGDRSRTPLIGRERKRDPRFSTNRVERAVRLAARRNRGLGEVAKEFGLTRGSVNSAWLRMFPGRPYPGPGHGKLNRITREQLDNEVHRAAGFAKKTGVSLVETARIFDVNESLLRSAWYRLFPGEQTPAWGEARYVAGERPTRMVKRR